MNLEAVAITISLTLLTVVLAFLTIRGFRSWVYHPDGHRLAWPVGLSFATAATTIEVLAYIGTVDSVMLEAYVFFSAAIVGVLALGALRAFSSPRWIRGYLVFTIAGLGALAVTCFSTPLPSSMVQAGVISGDPTTLLLALSILITVPATVVLLWASVISLRRRFRWQGMMILTGAITLGTGGFLYIASFPVILYYAEFIGIFLLFLGLVDLSGLFASAPRDAHVGQQRSA